MPFLPQRAGQEQCEGGREGHCQCQVDRGDGERRRPVDRMANNLLLSELASHQHQWAELRMDSDTSTTSRGGRSTAPDISYASIQVQIRADPDPRGGVSCAEGGERDEGEEAGAGPLRHGGLRKKHRRLLCVDQDPDQDPNRDQDPDQDPRGGGFRCDDIPAAARRISSRGAISTRSPERGERGSPERGERREREREKREEAAM